MPKHEERACPRCGNLFVCMAGSSGRCQCNGIELSPELLEHLADLYQECLCLQCLHQLRTEGTAFR